MELDESGILCHTVKGRLLVLQQFSWCIEFGNLSLVQHQNLVRVHNRIQSVGNSQYSALIKLCPDSFLQKKNR